MEKYTLTHNQKEKKYEFHINGYIAYITYEKRDDVLYLTHTIVPDILAGKGLAKKLTIAVMHEVESRGLKIQPECSYIVAFMEKHPEYKHLLS